MSRSRFFGLRLLSPLLLFSSLAFAFPEKLAPKKDKPPRLPSPYTLCPKALAHTSPELLFSCAEEEFWHGLSDGRLSVRRATEEKLSAIIRLTAKEDAVQKKGRLAGLRAYLRLAMALENGRLEHMLFGGMERDFQAAMRGDPENKVYKTFYDTIVIAKAAMMGRWEQAVGLADPAFDALSEFPTNILSLSGTTIGFPLATGIPEKTIAFMEEWVCPSAEKEFCTQNTEKAPYARAGLSFHFAEAYARIGDREKTLAYLKAAQAAPGYADWEYRALVEAPLADLDRYMDYWASFGEKGSAFDKVYANQNYGCVMCHGR